MIRLGGFLGRLLGPLLKTGLPLIKNVINPLAKRALIPLGLTAGASAADAGIHKKILECQISSMCLKISFQSRMFSLLKSILVNCYTFL